MPLLAPFFALCPAMVSAVAAYSRIWFCGDSGVIQLASTFRHWLVVGSADGGVHLCAAAATVCVLAVFPTALALVRLTGCGCSSAIQLFLLLRAPMESAI